VKSLRADGKKGIGKRNVQMSKKHLVAILAIVVFAVALASAAYFMPLQSAPPQFSMNAGIIDQLAQELPNSTFAEDATRTLQSSGFNVTYQNQTLNVDFFRNLARYNYGIIVLREHSALREDGSTVDLFTSEPFDPSAHQQELDDELLVEGILNYSAQQEEFFALTYKFIEQLEGTFPRSVVIAMGCNTLMPSLNQLAKAFIDKGATAFIGWDGYVGDSHSDSETSMLLERLLAYNMRLGDAVDKAEIDMTYGSSMACYPDSARNLKISEMIPKKTPAAALRMEPVMLNSAWVSRCVQLTKTQGILCSTETGLTRQPLEPPRHDVTQLVTKTVA
jgi:hypothetical protein